MSRERVQSFFHDVGFRFKTVAELDLHLANRFNVFRCIRPNENTISFIMRDLLDPRGTHGQGNAFLRNFLEMLQRPQDDNITKNAIADCEERTWRSQEPLRRIDLTVSFGEQFGIGIENKPWAGEQPAWVQDYSCHLSRRFRDFVLVFLTQDRRPPGPPDGEKAAQLEERGQFRRLSYKMEFSDWLEACYRDCRADQVRAFLKHFIDYAGTMEAKGMANDHEIKLVADYIQEDVKGRLKVAWAASQAWREVREKIAAAFLSELRTNLQQRLGVGWQITTAWIEGPGAPADPGAAIFAGYALRVFKSRWRDGQDRGIHLAPEAEGRRFVIGVCKKREVGRINGLNETLADRFGPGTTDEWWEWRQPVPPEYRDWDNPETLKKLAAKDGLDYFAKLLSEIAEAVEDRIDEAYPV